MLKSIWWTTPSFFRDGGGQAFRVAAVGGRSFRYQRQFVDGKSLSRYRDDNLPKLVVCQSLSVMQGVTYEQFEWFVRQSEEQISW